MLNLRILAGGAVAAFEERGIVIAGDDKEGWFYCRDLQSEAVVGPDRIMMAKAPTGPMQNKGGYRRPG